MRNSDDKAGLLELSKNEKKMIKRSGLFKVSGLCLAILGACVFLFGTYASHNRPMVPGEARLLRILIGDSILFTAAGWTIYSMAKLVEKMKTCLAL